MALLQAATKRKRSEALGGRSKYWQDTEATEVRDILNRRDDGKQNRKVRAIRTLAAANYKSFSVVRFWTLYQPLSEFTSGENVLYDDKLCLSKFVASYYIGRTCCLANRNLDAAQRVTSLAGLVEFTARHNTFTAADFEEFLCAKNIVKGLSQQFPVNMDSALFKLQLHNNHIEDDPWFKELYKLYLILIEEQLAPLTIFRSLYLCIVGRAPAVIEYGRAHPDFCTVPDKIHRFIHEFQGAAGDGSSTDTALFGPPGIAANCRMAA